MRVHKFSINLEAKLKTFKGILNSGFWGLILHFGILVYSPSAHQEIDLLKSD